MKFTLAKPTEQLRKYIKQYWFLEAENWENISEQYIYPEGNSELMFHYGTEFNANFIGQNPVKQTKDLFCSQKISTVIVKPLGPIGVLAVTFTPYGASVFFNLPFNELINTNISISDIMGDKITWLKNAIIEAESNQKRILIIEEFFKKSIIEKNLFEIEALRLGFAGLKKYIPVFSVDDFANASCMSFRQLDRVFKKRIGLSPKQYLKIARLNFAIAFMKTPSKNKLTNIAIDSGYYDQSHFTNDFQSIVGISPKKFSYLLCNDNQDEYAIDTL